MPAQIIDKSFHFPSFFQQVSRAPKGHFEYDVLILDNVGDLGEKRSSESIAEFAELSGDSYWVRSGLPIQKLEVNYIRISQSTNKHAQTPT